MDLNIENQWLPSAPKPDGIRPLDELSVDRKHRGKRDMINYDPGMQPTTQMGKLCRINNLSPFLTSRNKLQEEGRDEGRI